MGTTPSDELDPIQILAALGVSHPAAVTPVKGGWNTALRRVTAGGSTFALRVFRPEQS